MPVSPNKLSQFWQELKRRKVIYFLIAYVAACFAIIEFSTITSDTFSIPENTVKLLFVIAAIGLPLVIILPWFIFKKQKDADGDKLSLESEPAATVEQKVLHNLPAQLTTFIGREKEMETLNELIRENRLVSLIGAGGCGKTRLACEVASHLVTEYKDGVWLVDLSPIMDENLVGKEIMEVLDIKEVPNQTIVETLIDQIKDKEQLILLDNCEHLVLACAEITGKLLQSATGLKILVTSREALNIGGEQVWRIPSLTLIDPKTIINVNQAKVSEAVLLFADRARMNNPEFELESDNVNEVVTICNKLDGIPLAVELVASRTRHMNAQMILERFADQFDVITSTDPGTSKRQQTLQATIAWSYNLLSEGEQLLFSRLAVFSGGFDIEAAESVCSDDKLPQDTMLDVLSQLVDRSLVFTIKQADQSMRYNRLETLGQFAQKMLQSRNEQETFKKRHLEYFSGIAEKAYEEQFESQLKWLNKLELENDNLLAALDWSDNNSPEEFIKLSGALAWCWRQHNQILIGKDYLERAISKVDSKSASYGRLVFGLGMIIWYTGDKQGAHDLIDESLRIWRKLNNRFEEAIVLRELGVSYHSIGDFETSSEYSLHGLEKARDIGKPGLINHCLTSVCLSLTWSKKYQQARPLIKELYVSSEKLEQPFGILAAQHFLGDCGIGERKFEEAEDSYGSAIASGIKYNNHMQAIFDILGIAFALSGQSRLAKSIRLQAASFEESRKLGLIMTGIAEFWDEWIDTYIEGAKKEVGEELTRKYEEEGIAMGFEKAVEYALDFNKD